MKGWVGLGEKYFCKPKNAPKSFSLRLELRPRLRSGIYSNLETARCFCRKASHFTAPSPSLFCVASAALQIRVLPAWLGLAGSNSLWVDCDVDWYQQVAPVESYDDFDSVMKKLELSAASLAEVAANKERNFGAAAAPPGQSASSSSSLLSLSFIL